MELWDIIHCLNNKCREGKSVERDDRLCECKDGWAKKIGRPNQVKVEESLFYGNGGGCSK
jgi:hypothetical protein